MDFKVGERYFKSRRHGHVSSIRLVEDIKDGMVHYRVLHGPALKKQPTGRVSIKSMRRWTCGIYTGSDDYEKLAGAVLHKSIVVQKPDGEPLFRCSGPRADWYLKKGHAHRIDDDTIRLTNNHTVEKLHELYGGVFSPFFMAVKNDRCVVCGVDGPLTRHHVVPKRILPLLPQQRKLGLSNILFVCVKCHVRYNENDIGHDETDPYVWEAHFMEKMQPKYLPDGWKLYMIPPEDRAAS